MTKLENQCDQFYIKSENDKPNEDGLSPTRKEPKSVCRVLFLGAAKVGKTGIIRRFLTNTFEDKYIPTVDELYCSKFIVRGQLAKIELMDTSGSFDFPAMLRLCIAKADAFVIVFSNDSIESLSAATRYVEQIKIEREDYAPLSSATYPAALEHQENSFFTPSSPPLVAVCNKSDLPSSASCVNEGMVMEWLLKSGLKPSQFVYASAKTNEYILDIFKSLWAQNEISKVVTFEPWTNTRRVSSSDSPADAAKSTNSSPTDKNQPSSPGFDSVNKRPSVFRDSLKLRRRNSSRLRKSKEQYINLDCVIS